MLQHRAVETHQRSLRLWSRVATAEQEQNKGLQSNLHYAEQQPWPIPVLPAAG